MAAEQLILVDADDRVLGVGEKMRTHREGALQRAFPVFVFDRAGRLLLERRAAVKYHPVGWSNTARVGTRAASRDATAGGSSRGGRGKSGLNFLTIRGKGDE